MKTWQEKVKTKYYEGSGEVFWANVGHENQEMVCEVTGGRKRRKMNDKVQTIKCEEKEVGM